MSAANVTTALLDFLKAHQVASECLTASLCHYISSPSHSVLFIVYSLFVSTAAEWHHNLPFFMKRVQHSRPTPERLGFIKHALRTAQGLRVAQEQRRFYDLSYSSAHLHVPRSSGEVASEAEGYTSLTLPFSVHVMLHRACHAVVSLKPSASPPADPDTDCMTLAAFKRLVTVHLPRVLITPCSRCATPCAGECVCGAAYCSAACLEAEECNGCAGGCAQELKYLTPVAWGQAPLALP
jgi:hypothetical protein